MSSFDLLNRRRFHQLLSSSVALGLLGTSSIGFAQRKKGPVMFEHLVQANNAFAIKLFQDFEKSKPGENQFFSPFSIESALIMTSEGARGDTAKEMGTALSFPDNLKSTNSTQPWSLQPLRENIKSIGESLNTADSPELAQANRELESLRKELAETNAKSEQLLQQNQFQESQKISSVASELAAKVNALAKSANPCEVRIANAIWSEASMPLSAEFTKNLTAYYDAGAFASDFKNDARSECKRINEWVEEKTHDKIKDLIPDGALDSLTRLVLTNAIYFKGTWAAPFDESETAQKDFTTSKGTKVTVPLMSQNNFKLGRYAAFDGQGRVFETPNFYEQKDAPEFGYPDSNGFQIVELPYNGDSISMMILLPRSPKGLDSLMRQVSAEKLQSWEASLTPREFHVELPRFKLEASYGLKDSMMRLGMVKAFSDRPGVADFTGLTPSRDPDHQLFISAIIHKAFVEVNEKGTEAAAATAVIMARSMAMPRRPFIPRFTADHPFLFVLRDTRSGLILFMGKVENPA